VPFPVTVNVEIKIRGDGQSLPEPAEGSVRHTRSKSLPFSLAHGWLQA